jgi:tRNA uridine 5-carboxymethylaminomethyl modification enzyme
MTTEAIEKKKKVPRSRENIFQKDENGDLLVPIDQIKTLRPTEVLELTPSQIKYNRAPVSEEVRLKRIEQGKKLGALRREKYEAINAERERIRKEKEEAEAKFKEEEKERMRKEIEQQILDKKLIRVRVTEPKRRSKKQVETTETEATETEVTEDTDVEDERHHQRKLRKQALKTAKAIETIDSVISKHKNPYMDKLISLMR